MALSLRERSRDPVLWTNVLQMVKTVVAAVVAWLIAVQMFDLPQPFLAPWAALLTVHATVYRTLARGVQQVGAAVVGVLLAFAAGRAFGVNAVSLGAVILLALAIGSTRSLRAESTTAAATALVVLTTGYSDDGDMLVARLFDTGIGIGVGLAVTLVVWAPLRDRSAARQVDVIDDRIDGLLADIGAALRSHREAEDVEGWVDRSRELDGDIDRAWAVVREARESGRFNPRPGATARMRAAEDFPSLLHRLEQSVAELRSMARTIGRACESDEEWDARFREPWTDLLCCAGDAVAAADSAAIREVRDDLAVLAQELPALEDGPSRSWPVYGALIVNLRNIVDGMDLVAEAQPVRVLRRGREAARAAR